MLFHEAQRRHAYHYLEIMKRAQSLYLKGNESTTRGITLLETEWFNIQSAYAWIAVHAQNDDECAALTFRYLKEGGNCLSLRQDPEEHIRWATAALLSARHLKQRQWEGQALSSLGWSYKNMGQYRQAINCHYQHLRIATEINDRRGESEALFGLGNTFIHLGIYDRAISCLQRRVQIAIDLKDRAGEGAALGGLGLAYYGMGHYHRAIKYQQQRLKITRDPAVCDRLGESHALSGLGNAYHQLGDHQRAVVFHEQHLQIARQLADQLGESTALGNLGDNYYKLGDYGHAIDCHVQHAKIARRISDRLGEGIALFAHALVLDKLRRRTEAIQQAKAALELYEAIESPDASKVRMQLHRWQDKAYLPNLLECQHRTDGGDNHQEYCNISWEQ